MNTYEREIMINITDTVNDFRVRLPPRDWL
jgi:hypothetical protein